MAQHVVRVLSAGWEFRRDVDDKWLAVSRVPSNVHVELLRHGLIPDPFLNTNELEVSWVAEETWHYRTTFETPSDGRTQGVRVDLVFEGLDTFATVTLNGQVILESNNMFLEHRVSVGELLATDTENTVEIVFEPARRRGLDVVQAHPEHDFIVHQTEVSRGPVRKAQYHWGWDWGPILLTCGPWKPVRLETYVNRVEDVWVDYDIRMAHGEPSVLEATVHAQVIGAAARVECELAMPDGRTMSLGNCSEASCGASSWHYTSTKISVENPPLWWPRGLDGLQQLCELRVQLLDADGTTVLAEAHRTIGFRKVELVQESDDSGKSFFFRVNGVDIFSGGSCWIPADSFLSQISPQRYRDWIELLVEGNQNMVRVWGGGIYESDAFYSACDGFGILVWQDFMFACASYPTYPDFLASVTTEAQQNVRRLRHHPSIILWCGNNEDYQLIERYNLEYNYESDKDPQSWLKSTFPARYIYEHLLPDIVQAEHPSAIYHPGSPWGSGTSTTLKVDPTVGDVHQWDLWNGEARPWQRLPQMGGRFVSEFGMVAYPHADTLHRFVTDPAERYAGSATLDFHNKAAAHERRLLAYVGENFRTEWASRDLDAFAHLTQVLQADALAAGYSAWRRHWGKAGARRCGGVLVWQLNDCWPVVSWAVVDYYLVKKPAFYAIKRAMAPLAVGVARTFHDWTTRPADDLWKRNTGHVDPRRALTDIQFDVWVASSWLEAVEVKVVVRFISIRTGQEVRQRIERDVEVQPNGCTEVLAGCKFDWSEATTTEPEHFVIHASLLLAHVPMSSDTSWPDPLKYLDFSERGVMVENVGPGLVKVSADKPVKGFVFSERQGIWFSDNGFDIMPEEDIPTLVRIEGVGSDEELAWTYVGR